MKRLIFTLLAVFTFVFTACAQPSRGDIGNHKDGDVIYVAGSPLIAKVYPKSIVFENPTTSYIKWKIFMEPELGGKLTSLEEIYKKCLFGKKCGYGVYKPSEYELYEYLSQTFRFIEKIDIFGIGDDNFIADAVMENKSFSVVEYKDYYLFVKEEKDDIRRDAILFIEVVKRDVLKNEIEKYIDIAIKEKEDDEQRREDARQERIRNTVF